MAWLLSPGLLPIAGTEFMVRLQEQLKFFVAMKVSTDPLWQGPQVFLSGHETPGEGEHKIMEYIRYVKSQPGYDQNTRHCLYGLDADLIMLGLVSHEPHFSLLREEVRFGGKKDRNKRPPTPEETTFHLLHLSLLREYIDYEFSWLRGKLKFEYDVESIIDDWILMGFLVGNDFIPHLPHLHIHHDALPLLWRTYREVLPSLDGYLNTGGHLHLDRFEKYLSALAKFDKDTFENETYVDLKYWEGKTGKKQTVSSTLTNADRRKNRDKSSKGQLPGNQFGALMGSSLEPDDDLEDEDEDVYQTPDEDFTETDDDEDLMNCEFKKHKDEYYMSKLSYETVTKEVMEEQAQGYVLAIQWILLYYFEGVPSWSWYYPHHYAPYISDVKNFSHMRIRFELGTPFLPFQQLMAVLPAASKELLPKAYQELMTQENSPVIDFYPVDFKSDLNGKQQEWEAVVLIPFIDEKRLLSAMATKERQLSPAEKSRNQHGPCLVYQYTSDPQPPFPSTLPTLFPSINNNHAKNWEIPLDGFWVPKGQLVKGLLPGTRLDVHYPGFPTFKHIKHTTYLKKAGVKVFQMNSRGESMMLKIVVEGPTETLDAVATRLLGYTTFVGWPHLQEARVVAVSDGVKRIELEDGAPPPKKSGRAPASRSVRSLSQADLYQFQAEANSIKQRYHDRYAVEAGETDILIYCCTMTGRKYVCGSHSQITLEKQFSTQASPYALQASVKDIASQDPGFCQFKTLEDLFPADSPVFMLGLPHYGSQGAVLEVDQERARVRVAFSVPPEPDVGPSSNQGGMGPPRYMPAHVLSQRLGVGSHFISRITGTIFILRRTSTGGQTKVNIGLNMKFTKRRQELPGYTRHSDDGWSYSEKALEVISRYLKSFPSVADRLTKLGTGNDMFAVEEIFPENTEENLSQLQEFLQNLPCASVAPMEVGSDILDETDIQHIEQAVAKLKQDGKQKKQVVKILVKPSLLFRPVLYTGSLIPDPEAKFLLYDRVVVAKPAFGVPLGLRGTITGIHPAPKEVDVIYDVVFDEEFTGGITLRCSPKRGYRVPAPALINLTHGQRVEEGRQPHQATPRPYQQQHQAWGQGSAPAMRSPQKQVGGSSGSSRSMNSYSSLKGNTRQPFILMNPQGSPLMPGPSPTSSSARSSSQPAQRRPMPQQSTEAADFADIWKQLQGSPVAAASQPPQPQPPQPHPPQGRSCSPTLEAAMEAAMKITPPQLEGRSLFSQAARPHDAAAEEEFTAAFMRLEASRGGAAQPDPSSGQAAVPDLGGTNTNLNSNPAFAQDGSLQLKQMLKIGDAGSNGPAVSPTSPQPNRSYGRQVSLQELFSVAKQTMPGEGGRPVSLSSTEQQQQQPAVPQGAPPPPKSSPPRSASHPQQQARPPQPPATSPRPPGPLLSSPRPPHPGPPQQHRGGPMPPPPQGNLRGNPVNELKALAQRHQLGNVKYDFVKGKGHYTASVILGSGHRFEGTPCASREEAAESAASTALLLLTQGGQAAVLGMPGLGMPAQGPFFSQGSAFSPVRPRGPPHLLPHPQGYGPRQQPFRPGGGFPPFLGAPGPRGMGMPPPPMGGFPPNPHFPGGGQRPPGQFGPPGPFGPHPNQGPQLRQQQAAAMQRQQGPQPRPGGQPFPQQGMQQQGMQQQGMQQQGMQQQGMQQQGSALSQALKRSTDPSFIPLQVQRKQKPVTPRKADVVATVDGNGVEAPAPAATQQPQQPPQAPAEGLLIDLSEPDPAAPQTPQQQPSGSASNLASLSSPLSDSSPSPQPGSQQAKKSGKRRPRLAANFGNLQ